MKELPKGVQEEIKKEIGGYGVTTTHMEELMKLKEPERVREVAKAIKKEKLFPYPTKIYKPPNKAKSDEELTVPGKKRFK
jgi:hypothetical protein